ncbi:MAG: MATE family efflux transporter [Clostridiales bacterium]|nr:MATE family efflux transporter [Clostridiales bacterium]
MSKFENNLAQGSVAKKLILFALPFLLSNIIQSLYNVADMLIVGQFSGTASMSGVNIGGQITFIVTNIVIGFCAGGTIIIAQSIGSKDKVTTKETTSTLITLLAIIGMILTVVMIVLKNPILRLIKTPVESFSEASDYLIVTSLGILFIFSYNALSGILRGMGDSKRPFWFIAIACSTNIVLDLILVGVFQMGAKGAAIATVFSQALSTILCIIYLKKNDFIFDFKLKSFQIIPHRLTQIFKIGLPTAVQNGVVALSFLVITVLVNEIGVNASAAVGVVGKFNSFAIMPAIALSNSISTMAAQNIGAGEWGRAKKCCHIGMSIAVAITIIIFALAQIFAGPIISMFDDNPDVIQSGVTYMRTFSFDYLIVPFVFCFNGLFIGAGHTTFSLFNSLMSSLFFRIPAAILFGKVFSMGLSGIGLGAPIASTGSLIMVLFFYFTNRWRKNAVV